LDRFANTLEIIFELAADSQVKAIEAIQQGQRDIKFLHLQNASEIKTIINKQKN
jgi:virulence-associated protein VapD